MRLDRIFVTLFASFALSSPVLAQVPRLEAAPPPAGTTVTDGREHFTIASAILGETRRIFVATPASFAATGPERRYPLILVTDGEGHSATSVVQASRELSRNGLAPEMVVAGIENIGDYDERVRDLTPPGLSVSGSSRNEGGDRFLDFLERELMPALDARFRAAAPRVLIGHSSGGVIATYAAATRDTYRFVVALDTPVHLDGNWLAANLTSRAKAGGQPVRYASYNAVFGWSDKAWAELMAAAPSTWVLRHEKFANETHNSMPMLGAYLGLRELFADYSRKAAPVYPTTSVLPYYDKLTVLYGAPVVPPAPLMRDVVDDLLMEGRGALAGKAFDALVAAYGDPANAAATRARIAEAAARPAPVETVESLLATPFATADEIAPYIGEWEGESRMGTHQQTRLVLTIGVKDGRAAGQVVFKFAPGEELVQPLQYVTVQPDGLTYGYMNGMRPRGMLMYPMKKKDADTLEGIMRWGGVLPPTDGRGNGAPPERITFTRVRK